MDDRQSIDLAAMLCSRLCHDMLSPVGALSNGLELLAMETDPEMRANVVELLEQSATISTNKLKFFRLAFGAAGGFGERVEVAEPKALIEALVSDKPKVTINWALADATLAKPAVKVLLNFAQIAIDALRAAASPSPIAVDLGTGSGAIALSLATEVPHARVHAAENSVDAFVWTKENFAEVGAENARLAFIDLAVAFPELDGTVSVLVSNPPYVPDAATPRDPEVRLFDPPAALYGGEDGLDVVRTLAQVGLRLVHSGGLIAIEHGELQGAGVRDALAEAGWHSAATHRDLTLRDRVTTALRP